MRFSDDQIKKRLGTYKVTSNNKSRLQETIQKSKAAFYENESDNFLSGAEFLYQQGKYIRKRWWVLQGCILLILWVILELTESSFYIQRCMGIAAPLFAVLLLPELWKNLSTNSMEIECTAYYSLRQVYSARILLFVLIDFLLLCFFSFATILTEKMLMEEMMIQFFIPYIVTCCICFSTLYSRMIGSEAFALFLCIVWSTVWTQIVLNEKIYKVISLPIWLVMMAVAVLYLSYCIHKGQKNCKEIWEVK